LGLCHYPPEGTPRYWCSQTTLPGGQMLWLFQTQQPPRWPEPWTKMYSVTSDYPSRYIQTRVPSSCPNLWETSAGYGGLTRVGPPHITHKGTESSSGTRGCWVMPSGACSLAAVRKNRTWCCRKSCGITAAHHTPLRRRAQTL